MSFENCYSDEQYADAYSRLEFHGTYYLAFRDLPELLKQHVRGRAALDFGCGAGRSTRFLAQQGFHAIGVDIAAEMIVRARTFDPTGDYRLTADGQLGLFKDEQFDLVLAAFPFDNIPTRDRKRALFAEFRRVLRPKGRFVNIVSAPEIYHHEWASFSTRDFPENRAARCGDEVRVINLALDDRRPAVDIVWPEADYRADYAAAGLEIIELLAPLGRAGEPVEWVSEQWIAPWNIHVVGKNAER